MVASTIFLFLFLVYNSFEINGIITLLKTIFSSEIPVIHLSLREQYSKEFRKVTTFLTSLHGY